MADAINVAGQGEEAVRNVLPVRSTGSYLRWVIVVSAGRFPFAGPFATLVASKRCSYGDVKIVLQAGDRHSCGALMFGSRGVRCAWCASAYLDRNVRYSFLIWNLFLA
jgi:hypothetical protein